jgi:hypothetical protein
LFAPKTTYRFTLAGGFEKGNIGQNPWPGVSIDYYLPHQLSDSSTVVLEILDKQGQVIRTLSSEKDPGYSSWPGGPPPPQLLPVKPGLNRTYWNLGRETLPGVKGIITMGSLSGSIVGPGTYTLRVKLNGSAVEQAEEQTVEIKADPRLEVTEENFAAQQEMLVQMENAIREIHQSVIALRKVKGQLRSRLELLGEMQNTEALCSKGRDAMEAINNWEQELIQPKQTDLQDVINFENQLASELNSLRSKVDTYDPRPTMGARDRMNELLGQWDKLEKEKKRIIQNEIGEFNALYSEGDYPALLVPAFEK